MRQQGFTPIIIILIIVGVMVASFYIGLSTGKKIGIAEQLVDIVNETPQPTQASTLPSTVDETASWKTYKNNQYGFEFQYDKDSSISKEEIVNTTNSKDTTIYKDKYYAIELKDLKNINILTNRNKDIPHFILEIRDKTECSFIPYGGTTIQQTKVNIAEQQVKSYEFINAGDFTNFRACMINQDHTYDFISGYPNEADKNVKDKVKSTFNQILATFKFVN